MLVTRVTKLAVGGVVATLVAGGAAIALAGGGRPAPQKAVTRVADAVLDKAGEPQSSVEAQLAVGGPEEAATATASGTTKSSPGATARASSGITTDAADTSTGAAIIVPRPSTGGGLPAGGSGVVVVPGGTTGSGGGGGGTSNPGSNTGGSGGSGSSGGSGGSGGAGGSIATPTVPSEVSLYREGTYTVTVPGTQSVSKKLCLSGEVNRCRTVTVPALRGTSMTVSYSANTGTSAPKFSVSPCAGGLGVTVAGISPGTNVTVRVEGVEVTGSLSSREVSQSASLCDA